MDEPKETWSKIDKALYQGLRGLTSGSSLAQLLAAKRGVRNIQALPDLNIGQILEWVDAHHRRTGRWPPSKGGTVRDAPGEKWANINAALNQGKRGLAGGSSLPRLLSEKRGLRNPKSLPDLCIAQILKWADAHHRKTGAWPNTETGKVLDSCGEKWANIHGALYKGLRGLPGGSSLARLLAKQRGSRNLMALPTLNIGQILEWADEHRFATGDWPKQTDGAVTGAQGEKWANIDAALSNGLRGLAGGSSLAKLLAEQRGKRNPKALPKLTLKQVLVWAEAHRKETGAWPKRTSGAVLGAPSESWLRLDGSLSKGRRGLPGGSSLAKLLRQERG